MKPEKRNYTKIEKETALALYDKLESVTAVIQHLGYPTRTALYQWLYQRNKPVSSHSSFRGINTAEHPRHPSAEFKLEILHRCFELGEDVSFVSEETGYSRASIYYWRKQYLSKGSTALMNSKDRPRGKLQPPEVILPEEKEELNKKIAEMQMEIDILKETINVLKKDPGANLEPLKNREKAVIVDALKDRYPLPKLLKKVSLAKSSYYYQKAKEAPDEKKKELRAIIIVIFHDSGDCYGYRRIHAMLKRMGHTVSEKVVRRLMQEEDLLVKIRQHRKYSSYKGEISPEVPNLVQRDFQAERPNVKWLTDITEFAIPAGKIYLSPLMDCFDGLLPAWTIGTAPNATLVNEMLDKAIQTLSEGERPLIHTDRGCHYRWPGWIERMEKAGLIRSMSKKGCSPDNSACEGLFGRIKNEMFYNRDWSATSIPEFMAILNDYLSWYNEKRIKVKLGNMSPVEYRQSLGFAA